MIYTIWSLTSGKVVEEVGAYCILPWYDGDPRSSNSNTPTWPEVILDQGNQDYGTMGFVSTKDSNEYCTPWTSGRGSRAEPEFKIQYQSAVDTLMYAMLGTRPDIAYVVSSVCWYYVNPTKAHMAAVKRIFSYLRGTIDLHLTFWRELTDLVGYSDSHRSTAGFVFNFGSGAIIWSSKWQPTIALSTNEAEYQSQTYAAKEDVWLRSLL